MIRLTSQLGILAVFAAMTSVIYQNCATFQAGPSLSGVYAGSSYCTANPADTSCVSPPGPTCVFNGQTVSEGGSVTAYLSSTGSAQTCQSQTRTCHSGVLSGNYAYASCSTSGPVSCLFNGLTVPSGQGVTAYLTSTVAYGATCSSENRSCLNGVLGGSDPYASCSVQAPASCLFNGLTIAHGSSVTAYLTSSVPVGSQCQPVQRTCYNGALSGQGAFASCAAVQGNSCLFNGQTVPSEGAVIGYDTSSVPYGQACKPHQRLCNNGSLSSTGAYASCVVDQPAACLINGQTIPSGSSTTLYFQSVDPVCAAEVRTCTNGVLSGSATNASCQYPAGVQVTSFSFATLANYQSDCQASAPRSAACAAAISRACGANGSLSGFGPIEYTSTTAFVGCVSSSMASLQSASWGTLQASQSTCDASHPGSDVCNSAVNRYCLGQGFKGALNIVESNANTAYFLCLSGLGAAVYNAPWGELHVASHSCSQPASDHGTCLTSASRYCQSLGGQFATGFGVQETATMTATVTCLSTQASASTRRSSIRSRISFRINRF